MFLELFHLKHFQNLADGIKGWELCYFKVLCLLNSTISLKALKRDYAAIDNKH